MTELEELRRYKANYKDGWAYARKMDKLRQEAEKKVKTQEELMELVNKVAEAYKRD